MLRLLLAALVVEAIFACGSTECPAEARSLLSVKVASKEGSSASGNEVGEQVSSQIHAGKKKSALRLSEILASKANHSDDCFPVVFVVATGRSGSTSLLQMLNAIPGYDLKGENGGSWNLMYNLFHDLQDLQTNYSSEQSGHAAWLGIDEVPNLHELLRGFQRLLLGELNPKPGARVTGFKEIRWDFDHELADVELLLQAFPCGRVILNYRTDTDYQAFDANTVFSESERENVSAMRAMSEEYRTSNRAIHEFSNRFPDHSFMLPLENFTLEAFNDLLHWLGEDEHCRYVEVMHGNDAYGSQTIMDDNHYINCDYNSFVQSA